MSEDLVDQYSDTDRRSKSMIAVALISAMGKSNIEKESFMK